MSESPSRWSNPLSEPNGLVGPGAVLYDVREPMLDELHKRKIDDADRVHVINVDGYIGDSTQSEIEYARSQGKPVTFYEGAKTDA